VAGAPAADVRPDLEEALFVIAETGAGVFEPFVREELARLDGDPVALARVEGLFTSIGADGHARRIREELGG
jgi:hypothetical protein